MKNHLRKFLQETARPLIDRAVTKALDSLIEEAPETQRSERAPAVQARYVRPYPSNLMAVARRDVTKYPQGVAEARDRIADEHHERLLRIEREVFGE